MPDKALFSLHNTPIEAALAGWHAEPVDATAACTWLKQHVRATPAPFDELIARHWCGQDIRRRFTNLCDALADPAERALLDLIYGQLLIAQRLVGAFTHLDRGFAAATPFLAPRAYLTVLKRHETLRWLVLGRQPSSPLALTELLQQAQVTKRLRASGGEDPRFPPEAGRRPADDDPTPRGDTVG